MSALYEAIKKHVGVLKQALAADLADQRLSLVEKVSLGNSLLNATNEIGKLLPAEGTDARSLEIGKAVEAALADLSYLAPAPAGAPKGDA